MKDIENSLTIDLSAGKKVVLLLKQGREVISRFQWTGLYKLSETLLPEIDKLLKKNKIKLTHIKEIEVKASQESMVGTRIAKVIALGLKYDKL